MPTDPRFLAESGREVFTGNELLIKGALEAEGGVHLLTGYPGSPVASFFDILGDIKDLLNKNGVRAFQANNEALGVAAVNGSQMAACRAIGVMKSVGVHVASDALALGNLSGAHEQGGGARQGGGHESAAAHQGGAGGRSNVGYQGQGGQPGGPEGIGEPSGHPGAPSPPSQAGSAGSSAAGGSQLDHSQAAGGGAHAALRSTGSCQQLQLASGAHEPASPLAGSAAAAASAAAC